MRRGRTRRKRRIDKDDEEEESLIRPYKLINYNALKAL